MVQTGRKHRQRSVPCTGRVLSSGAFGRFWCIGRNELPQFRKEVASKFFCNPCSLRDAENLSQTFVQFVLTSLVTQRFYRVEMDWKLATNTVSFPGAMLIAPVVRLGQPAA
jgi:hypothetical protein